MIQYLLLLIIDQYSKYIYCTHKNYGIDFGIKLKYPYIYNEEIIFSHSSNFCFPVLC